MCPRSSTSGLSSSAALHCETHKCRERRECETNISALQGWIQACITAHLPRTAHGTSEITNLREFTDQPCATYKKSFLDSKGESVAPAAAASKLGGARSNAAFLVDGENACPISVGKIVWDVDSNACTNADQ